MNSKTAVKFYKFNIFNAINKVSDWYKMCWRIEWQQDYCWKLSSTVQLKKKLLNLSSLRVGFENPVKDKKIIVEISRIIFIVIFIASLMMPHESAI